MVRCPRVLDFPRRVLICSWLYACNGAGQPCNSAPPPFPGRTSHLPLHQRCPNSTAWGTAPGTPAIQHPPKPQRGVTSHQPSATNNQPVYQLSTIPRTNGACTPQPGVTPQEHRPFNTLPSPNGATPAAVSAYRCYSQTTSRSNTSSALFRAEILLGCWPSRGFTPGL